MASTKRVFESFIDFIKTSPIYEGNNEPGIDLGDIMIFMDDLIKKQKELAEKSSLYRKTFGEIDDPEEALRAYLEAKGKSNNKSVEQYSEYIKTNKTAYRNISTKYAVAVWDTLKPEEKDQLAIKLLAEANSKGYKSPRDLMKIISDKDKLVSRPFIGVLPDTMKREREVVSGESVEYAVIDEIDEVGLFKPNKYEMDDASFSSEIAKDRLIEDITLFLSQMLTDELDVESITIHSSANRFRNTSGDDNTLSWGEISYQRAATLSKVMIEIAKSLGFTDDMIETLVSKTSLDYYGDNGDGTSGPNPPTGIKFGYYDAEDGFVEGDRRNEVVVYEIDEKGEPIKEDSVLEIEPLGSAEDYQEFMYVNMVVKGKMKSIDDTEDVPVDLEFGEIYVEGMLPSNNKYKVKRRKPNIGISKMKRLKGNTPKKRSNKIKPLPCPKW